MRTRRLRRSLPVLALLALAPVAGATSTAHAATLTVCPSGCAYAQIQPAINAASTGDTISIGAGAYYGGLDITKNVTLAGAGAGSTTIQGIHLGYPNNTNERAIVIERGATVRIQGVTITSDGTSSSDPIDGGIANEGTLTITNSAISHNRGDFGGGIANEGTLTVTNSTISRNFATATGGGITNYAGATVTVGNSAISGNYNLGTDGGGIANAGTLTVANSVINNNNAYIAGGGISNDGGATATVTNSTISGNTANDYQYDPGIPGSGDTYGGGIFNQGSALTITNSTISNNGANYTGGGIENDLGTVTLSNAILAENTAPTAYPDCRGTLNDGSGGHNLIGDGSDCSGLTNGTNGDQVGTYTNPIDPKLGPLQDNGGPTQTMALLFGSPAISAGDPTTCESLVGPTGAHDSDQRGQSRNTASRGACDVGAFDTAQIPVCPSGCAYTQIQPALDAAYSGDTINIGAGAYSGGLAIGKSVTLVGAGAGSVTIQGGDSVVSINSGVTVRIQGVTITGGNASYYGGGIQNHGALTLDRSTVSGNTTNAAVSYSGGGGIANVGALTVTNSTISGNSAQVGGGIYDAVGATLTLANSTISGNSAHQQGGLYSSGHDVITLSGTILARNTASMSPDCAATLTDGPGGHNLLGNNSDCTGLTNGTNGDQVGTGANPIDPKLGPLQNTGGPTQTQALLPGSPAIDAIPTSTGLCPATDQRGVSRPDDNEGFCDIGAYESTYTLLATSLSAVSGSGTYGGTAILTATLTAGATPVSGKIITFTLNGNPICGGSGQPACPTTDANGVATLQGVSLAGITAGSYATAVGASFAGDTGYSASNATGALTVGKATHTITFGPLASHTYGDRPFQVNATASSGLAVSFSATGACAVTGNTVTITGAGSCTVTAAQGGDTNDNPAQNVSQTFSIAQASATIALDQSSLGATYDGNPHLATATTNPSGLSYSVSYTDANNNPVTNPINAGSYTVSASVTDPNYSGRTTGALVIAKANQSIAVTTPAPSSAAYNSTFTVAATASSGLNVTYGSSGSCSNTGATVTMTSGGGTCTVTVDQAGNGNYNAAQEVTETVTAQKATQTITFGALASHTYGDRPFQVSATASSGLAVSFSATGACAVSGATVTITGAGSCTVTATQGGDSNYNAAPTVPQTLSIAKAGATTTLTSSANPSVAGRPVTYTAMIAVTSAGAGSPGGTVAFKDNGRVITGCGAVGVGATGAAICPVSYATAGSHPITAVYSGDSNDAGSASNTVNQTVSSDLTTSLTLSPNPVARGATLTISGSATNSGTASESVTLSYTTTAPNGTTTSSSLGTVTVGPGKTVARTTTYKVPRNAPTGAYTVTLIAQDKTGSSSSTAKETVS